MMEIKDHKVILDRRVQRETKVMRAMMDQKDQKETKEIRVIPAP